MKSSLLSLFALVAIVPALVSAQATINTPASVVQCQPAQVTWEGGQPPYYLSIFEGSDPSTTPFRIFPETEDTSMTWNVAFPEGETPPSQITFQIRDGTGAVNYSSQVGITANPSGDTCVDSSASAPASTGSASAASTASSSATTTSSSSSTSHSNHSGSSETASDSNSSNDASQESSSNSDEDDGALTLRPFVGAAAGLVAAAAAIAVGA